MHPSSEPIAKHVIVVSYDAFSEDHFEQAKRFPHLKALINNGAYTTKLKSVYPTMTYVVHSTMVTGVYPDKHGVIHNNPLQPFVESKNQAWHWYQKDLHVPTIYDAVGEAGLKTAGILWPVTAQSSITYNLPEVVAINGENQALKVLKNGSPLFCLGLELKYGRIRQGTEQPYLDDFSTACAVDVIKRKKPNLLLLHLIDLDDTKHACGTKGEAVDAVIERMDKRLGELLRATEEAGIEDDTVFIVLGDHGQLDVQYNVHLNNLLKDEQLIYSEESDGQWRCYFQSTGGSAYLHIKPGDESAERDVVRVLEKLESDPQYGIERIYNREELKSFRVDDSIKYMVEAKPGYSFEDALTKQTVVDLKEEKKTFATHGYSPDKEDYRCNCIVSGKAITSGTSLGEIEMVDMAPTIADLLGVRFLDGDGKSFVDRLR